MSEAVVLYEVTDSIATITINRHDALNAMNRDVLLGLGECIDRAIADTAVRAIIVTGAGDRAFSAGADISMLNALTPQEVHDTARLATTTFARLEHSGGKPTLAVINGYALGGGLELAESCMMRIAVRGVKMGHPEVRIGAVAAWGGTARMPRLIGSGRAAMLLLSGRSIDADTALSWGLVNAVVGPEELMSTARTLLKDIIEQSPEAIALTADALFSGLNMTMPEALALGVEHFGQVAATKNFKEGTDAFLQKRKPQFS